MKNVQIIDGAENSEYAIFSFTDEQFYMIFPEREQDIEFIEDLQLRCNEEELEKIFDGAWSRKLSKSDVNGIHGTLFYELINKKKYYPNKKESDLD